MLIWSERYWHVYSSLNMGKSSPSLWPATSDSCCACWQYTLSSQILLMWSSQYSLQNLAKRNKRMENLFMLIWSERYWHVYSSLNMGKSSPSLWPATSDSCCACWQYTLSSQILPCDHLKNLFKTLVTEIKEWKLIFMLIWSERLWNVDSRQVYSSFYMGKSSPSLWRATSDSRSVFVQWTLSSQLLQM